jgi:hypothetical protein
MGRFQVLGLVVALLLLAIWYDKTNNGSKGLGDSVANLAAFLGIKKQPGCGCQARHNALNEILPYQ